MKTVAPVSTESFSLTAPNGIRFVGSKTTKPGLIRFVSGRVAAAEELWKKETEKRDAKKMAAYLRVRERFERQEMNRNRALVQPEVLAVSADSEAVEALVEILREENDSSEQTAT